MREKTSTFNDISLPPNEIQRYFEILLKSDKYKRQKKTFQEPPHFKIIPETLP